jgi:hypothetical protein
MPKLPFSALRVRVSDGRVTVSRVTVVEIDSFNRSAAFAYVHDASGRAWAPFAELHSTEAAALAAVARAVPGLVDLHSAPVRSGSPAAPATVAETPGAALSPA